VPARRWSNQARIVPAPTDVTLDEINAAIDNGVKLQNEKGEEMVCRKEAKTGSRLARETVCMTKAEWTRVSEESQRATQKTMRLGKIPAQLVVIPVRDSGGVPDSPRAPPSTFALHNFAVLRPGVTLH
jgi:hypothetical protein